VSDRGVASRCKVCLAVGASTAGTAQSAVSKVLIIRKYVSFDSMIELWLKLMQIECLALKARSRTVYFPPHKNLAHPGAKNSGIFILMFTDRKYCKTLNFGV